MHNKHYIKQMKKRSRIGDYTLVMGIDIGSEFNAVCFMDKEGNVFGRYLKIYNSRKGFRTLSVLKEKPNKINGVIFFVDTTERDRRGVYVVVPVC